MISWLTLSPETLPATVDRPLDFSLESILQLEETEFDYLFSLDKDPEACALANRIRAKTKKGFYLKNGACAPFDDTARAKWLTGLFDDLNRTNQKSYPQEIFEICGYSFAGEPYWLELEDTEPWQGLPPGRPRIGLNTGCGVRWMTRLWPEDAWTSLARSLREDGFGVILLGGEQEVEQNRRISRESGAFFPGTFPLPRFFSLMNQCDIIVTAVSMAMHAAIGFGKRLVLFNNVFNRQEFELYGLGEILEPEDLDCKGCFRNECDKPCMETISAERVREAILRQVHATHSP